MAKAGREAVGRQVANDYAVNGIRCNNLVVVTVRPESGDVSTLPADFDHEPLDRAIAPTTMLGTVGRYADVAAAALFLVSDQSRYITGANIPVEGGALGRVQYPDYTEIRSEEHTSELQSLMRISYAVFCLKKKKNILENLYYN